MKIAIGILVLGLAPWGFGFDHSAASTGELLALPFPNEEAEAKSIVAGMAVERAHPHGPFIIRPKGADLGKLAERLRSTGAFQVVEENRLLQPLGVPNDPFFSQQWYLNQIGAPRAWDFATGSGIKVAIVDTGIDLTHPEFAGRILPGYNSVDRLTVAQGGQVSDVQGHGTNMAGVLAAKFNNGVGVAGVAPECNILPVRASNLTSGTATLADLDAGVRWAADQGAVAITVSFTGVENAIVGAAGTYAKSHGAVLVWAAGNAGQNLSTFDWPDVVVVGGTGLSDERAVWGASSSAYGLAIDVVAPARQIRTTQRGGGYQIVAGGTSFAAPQVAGLVALIKEVKPSITPDQAVFRIQESCTDLGALGPDDTFGYGRINAAKAVIYPNPHWIPKSLPLVTPGASLYAISDMNNSGAIVGSEQVGSVFNALYWPPSGNPIILTPPNGYKWGGPYGALKISDNGTVWGRAENSNVQEVRIISWSPTAGFTLYGVSGNSQLRLFEVAPNGSAAVTFDPNGSQTVEQIYVASGGSYTYFGRPDYFTNWPIAMNSFNQMVGFSNQRTGGTGANSMYWKSTSGNFTALNFIPAKILEDGGIFGQSTSGNAVYLRADGSFDPNVTGPGSVVRLHPQGYLLGSNQLWRGPGGGNFGDFSAGVWTDFGLTAANTSTISVREISDQLRLLGYADNLDKVWDYSPGFSLNVNLGQLGEGGQDPITVGAIPPVVAVTYTDASGTPFPGQNPNGQLLNYNAAIGTIETNQLPSFVTGPFRVLYQANRTVIPNLTTSSWLNRLYPPIGQQAMPLDTISLPLISLPIGDIDDDNEIGPGDFAALATAFGTFFLDPDYSEEADINGDGEVGPGDFAILAENFGLVGD